MADATQEFLKELALSGHPLLKRIVAFNALLAQRLHPSEAEAPISGGLLPARSAFAAQRLRSSLSALLGEEFDPWVLDFRQPPRRIALLPPDCLQRLIHWYGLAAFRDEIVRRIDREAVTALNRLVGPEGWRFAVYRAALLTGNRVPVPEDLRPEEGLSERILRTGRGAVLACILGSETGGGSDGTGRLLVKRLRLMLPQELPQALSGAVLPSAPTVWPVVRKLVIKEIAPAWTPCFA